MEEAKVTDEIDSASAAARGYEQETNLRTVRGNQLLNALYALIAAHRRLLAAREQWRGENVRLGLIIDAARREIVRLRESSFRSSCPVVGTAERYSIIAAAVAAIEPCLTNNTHAWNTWNNIASNADFRRAILLVHADASLADSAIPPEGWLPFGAHVGDARPVEFSTETDDAGLPRWERPITVVENVEDGN